jgi:hypothetical protein
MASKPTQRSLAHLRQEGWTVCIVEKYLPARGNMKFPRRIDAFGFGDLLACRAWARTDNPTERTEKEIALVQTTGSPSSGGWFAQHRAKILALPEFQQWKDAGGLVLLHGWAKRGPRGKRKVWTLREEVL